MAGDWLKIEAVTPDKPEIFSIAKELGLSPDDVFGKCFRVWVWFDAHTTNGECNGAGVTEMLLDRYAGVTGFAKAMINVGWITDSDHGLAVHNFSKHNGESSKQRALTAKRVTKLRQKLCNAPIVTLALPEKRREDNTYTPPIPGSLLKDFLKVRKAKRVGELTETAFNGIAREASKAGISVTDAIEICCRRGWASFDSSWDWGKVKIKGLAL